MRFMIEFGTDSFFKETDCDAFSNIPIELLPKMHSLDVGHGSWVVLRLVL